MTPDNTPLSKIYVEIRWEYPGFTLTQTDVENAFLNTYDDIAFGVRIIDTLILEQQNQTLITQVGELEIKILGMQNGTLVPELEARIAVLETQLADAKAADSQHIKNFTWGEYPHPK